MIPLTDVPVHLFVKFLYGTYFNRVVSIWKSFEKCDVPLKTYSILQLSWNVSSNWNSKLGQLKYIYMPFFGGLIRKSEFLRSVKIDSLKAKSWSRGFLEDMCKLFYVGACLNSRFQQRYVVMSLWILIYLYGCQWWCVSIFRKWFSMLTYHELGFHDILSSWNGILFGNLRKTKYHYKWLDRLSEYAELSSLMYFVWIEILNRYLFLCPATDVSQSTNVKKWKCFNVSCAILIQKWRTSDIRCLSNFFIYFTDDHVKCVCEIYLLFVESEWNLHLRNKNHS